MPTHIARARPPVDPSAESPDGLTIDESPEATKPYLDDAAHFPGGHASGVARPRHEADVAGLVRAASRVLPVGAQSSVTGGATPDGGLVLSTEHLRGVHEAGQHRFRAGAGVALDALQELLRKRGRWYAPTPTFTGALMGGVAATNAAGAATFKYGTTRDWVEGLTVVLACGHVLSMERGDVVADPDAGFAVDCDCGRRRFAPGTYRMPDVPKCSAGYFAAPGMDLVDLFVGSEGTLGVITDVTVRTIPVVPSAALAAVFADSERSAFDFVSTLRDASRETWRTRAPDGIDVAAVEHLDRRCLEVLREDGIDTKLAVNVPDGTELLILIQLELAGDVNAATAFDQAARANEPGTPDSAIGRFTRLLGSFGWLDRSELVMPGNERRTRQFLAFREAAPTGVNARVAEAKRTIDARIDKTAGDMIVPFDTFGELMTN